MQCHCYNNSFLFYAMYENYLYEFGVVIVVILVPEVLPSPYLRTRLRSTIDYNIEPPMYMYIILCTVAKGHD